MPTKQQETQHKEQEKHERPHLDAAIVKNVLRTLGQPGDLQRVQVRSLWMDHYRVNVLVGADAVSARVAHSYFMVIDSNGNISASTPNIVKMY